MLTRQSILEQLAEIEKELNMVRNGHWSYDEMDGTLIHLDQLRGDIEDNKDSYFPGEQRTTHHASKIKLVVTVGMFEHIEIFAEELFLTVEDCSDNDKVNRRVLQWTNR